MFNFLNSAILIAAAAAIIPLLIHLFSRRRVKVVEFSSLRHLKQMQKRQVRRLKIRQLLLLLLRMLIIFVAVLAFARPATKGGYIGSHAGVSAAILLDKSASMNRQVKDGKLFDLARKKTEDILHAFGEADNLILIPFDNREYYPAGQRLFSSDIADEIVNKVQAGYDKDNLSSAITGAIDFLNESKNLNKEIYLVGDRQIINLDNKIDSMPDNMSFYLAELPVEAGGNCGIINVDLGGQLIAIGSPFNIRAEVKNYDNLDKTELLASLFVDGTRMVQSEFKLESNGSEAIQFDHTIHKTGLHSGYVEISDDGYAPDNRFYFSINIPEKFNVLIIDGDTSGEMIKLALVPDESLARYWSVKSITPENVSSVRFADYDAIAMAGVDSIAPVLTRRILQFVDAGGGLFYVPGAMTDIASFNKELGNRTGFRFSSPLPTSISRAGYYTMERFDYSHPVFQAFDIDSIDTEPILKYFALPEIESEANIKALAYFSNGQPAIVESQFGMGKFVSMTAPIFPAYTDLAGHSFFVPMIIRTMEYLAGDPSSYNRHYEVGTGIQRTVAIDKTDNGRLTMLTPDNRSFDLNAVEQSGQALFDCRPIDAPGLYTLMAGNKAVDMFAVNMSPDESDLTSADPNELSELLGINNARYLPYDKPAEPIIASSRYGRELWKIILWAVAILLAVEMLLSRDRQTEAT